MGVNMKSLQLNPSSSIKLPFATQFNIYFYFYFFELVGKKEKSLEEGCL